MTPDLCFDFKKKKRLLICVLVAVLQEYKLILIVRELSLKIDQHHMILLHMNAFIEVPEYDLKCSFRFTDTAETVFQP